MAKQVVKGAHTSRQDLLTNGCDSYDEIGRDCYMLPDNHDNQVDVDTIRIER
jgi:hypothetical protein